MAESNLVKITHFVNPHMFWFKFEANCVNNLKLFEVDFNIQKYYGYNHLRDPNFRPQQTQIIGAYNFTWNRWVRAVVEYVVDLSPFVKQYIVWAIDYGFPMKADYRYIRQLPYDLASVKLDVIHFGGLNNIVPAKKVYSIDTNDVDLEPCSTWSTLAVNTVENLLNAALTIKFIPSYDSANKEGQIFGSLQICTHKHSNIHTDTVLKNMSEATTTKDFFKIVREITRIPRWQKNDGSSPFFVTNIKNVQCDPTPKNQSETCLQLPAQKVKQTGSCMNKNTSYLINGPQPITTNTNSLQNGESVKNRVSNKNGITPVQLNEAFGECLKKLTASGNKNWETTSLNNEKIKERSKNVRTRGRRLSSSSQKSDKREDNLARNSKTRTQRFSDKKTNFNDKKIESTQSEKNYNKHAQKMTQNNNKKEQNIPVSNTDSIIEMFDLFKKNPKVPNTADKQVSIVKDEIGSNRTANGNNKEKTIAISGNVVPNSSAVSEFNAILDDRNEKSKKTESCNNIDGSSKVIISASDNHNLVLIEKMDSTKDSKIGSQQKDASFASEQNIPVSNTDSIIEMFDLFKKNPKVPNTAGKQVSIVKDEIGSSRTANCNNKEKTIAISGNVVPNSSAVSEFSAILDVRHEKSNKAESCNNIDIVGSSKVIISASDNHDLVLIEKMDSTKDPKIGSQQKDASFASKDKNLDENSENKICVDKSIDDMESMPEMKKEGTFRKDTSTILFNDGKIDCETKENSLKLASINDKNNPGTKGYVRESEDKSITIPLEITTISNAIDIIRLNEKESISEGKMNSDSINVVSIVKDTTCEDNKNCHNNYNLENTQQDRNSVLNVKYSSSEAVECKPNQVFSGDNIHDHVKDCNDALNKKIQIITVPDSDARGTLLYCPEFASKNTINIEKQNSNSHETVSVIISSSSSGSSRSAILKRLLNSKTNIAAASISNSAKLNLPATPIQESVCENEKYKSGSEEHNTHSVLKIVKETEKDIILNDSLKTSTVVQKLDFVDLSSSINKDCIEPSPCKNTNSNETVNENSSLEMTNESNNNKASFVEHTNMASEIVKEIVEDGTPSNQNQGAVKEVIKDEVKLATDFVEKVGEIGNTSM